MATRIQLRRDTAANWEDANPTLATGEAGYDLTNNQMRIGDGERNWKNLTPINAEVNLSVYATKSALQQEAAARAAADVQHSDDIDGLQMQIDAIVPDDDSALTARVDDLTERVEELEENGGGGNSGTVLNWTFNGFNYFTNPGPGNIIVHPDGIGIYVSKTNSDGTDITAEFLNEVVAGNLFSLQVPARTNGETGDPNQYQQFSIQQNPVDQGSYWNVATQRIINANSQNSWQDGIGLDMVVQVAPTTRTLLIDEESQPEDIITDPELISAWEVYKETQGWPEGYIASQKDVNHFFNEVDHLQQEEIRGQREKISNLESQVKAQDERLDALEENPGGFEDAPADDQQYARCNNAWEVVDFDAPMHLEFEWQGEEWWPDKVKEGEMFGHKSESSLFFANVDENGIFAAPILDAAIKPGTTLLVTKTKDRSRWAHFTCTSGTSVQSWGRSCNVRLNSSSEKEIKEDDDVTVMFNVTTPAIAPHEGVYPIEVDEVWEELEKFKKQITALKGELTKLKKRGTS